MRKWEYKIIKIEKVASGWFSFSFPDIENELNLLGIDGWELISFSPIKKTEIQRERSGNSPVKYTFDIEIEMYECIFKREKV